MSATHTIHGVTLALQEGDITRIEAEAVVNAANSALAGGGGVDGAIHRAAGPAIVDECRKIGGCPTGSAVVTSAGRMSARYIFHAVGPIYQGRAEDETLLRSAYQSCLDLAEQYHVCSIVFPSISTGVYGYPLPLAAPVALQTVLTHIQKGTCLRQITFALFGHHAYEAFTTALNPLLPAQE